MATRRERVGQGRTARRACRRRETGSFASLLFTFSLLLLVMALGFVFGRVVITKTYVKASDSLHKAPDAALPRGEAAAATGQPATETPEGAAEGQQPGATAPTDETPSADTSPGDADQAAASGEDNADGADTPQDTSTQEVRYAIQVGAYSSQQSARQTESDLAGAGYPARIVPERQGGRTTYKVLTGRYQTEENAQQVADELKRQGFPGGFVVEAR